MSSEQPDLSIATTETGIEATGGPAFLATGLVAYFECKGKLDSAFEQGRKLLISMPCSTLVANDLAILLTEYKDDDASRAEATLGKLDAG